MFKDETTDKPGGANNPDGLGGWSGKTESNLVNTDNVSIDKIKPAHGNSKAYTNSRLSKQNPELLNTQTTAKRKPF